MGFRRSQKSKQPSSQDASGAGQPPSADQSAQIDFENVFSGAPDPMLIVDDSGRCLEANAAACRLTGYERDELIGRSITDLAAPGTTPLGEERDTLFPTHTESNIDWYLRRKNGTEIPVAVSISVGRPRGRMFTVVLRDMSSYRSLLEELNDALQRLRFHVERMPLAYIVWDKDFRVLEWNPMAERIFGYRESEASGRSAYELLVAPESRTTVEKIWSDLLEGDTSSHSINVNVRKDGSRLTCEWWNTPLRDSEGNIRGVASMAMDVTEREAIEGKIRDAQKLESLGVMASGIAHDFNSSLMVILGNAALLRSLKGLPPQASEYLELIEEAGARSDKLIKHLLAYARTGRHHPQPTDLNAVIHEALRFVSSSVGRDHQITLDLAQRLPAIVADHSQIEQIMLNLCLNARHAMPAGGTITIATRSTTLSAEAASRCVPYDLRPGDYVELDVADHGCGMDEATVSRVFDPFFTTRPDGHGLGLAAVLGILRQHNAGARIESAPGRGTRARVFFPARQDVVLPDRTGDGRWASQARDGGRNRKRTTN